MDEFLATLEVPRQLHNADHVLDLVAGPAAPIAFEIQRAQRLSSAFPTLNQPMIDNATVAAAAAFDRHDMPRL
jgi:hypothetical protein